jgi:hypothetical protein
MAAPTSLARLGICLMIVLPAYFCSTALAASSAHAVVQADELVNLTVTSTCGSANVQVKGRGVLTTPISLTFPRGKTIQLRALGNRRRLAEYHYRRLRESWQGQPAWRWLRPTRGSS